MVCDQTWMMKMERTTINIIIIMGRTMKKEDAGITVGGAVFITSVRPGIVNRGLRSHQASWK
jgi:hypothetical protein